MKLLSDSLSIVIRGDWCRTYSNYDWIRDNIFQEPDSSITIEIESNNTAEKKKFYCRNVSITPTLSSVTLSAGSVDAETLGYLAQCASNYVANAMTPKLRAYGLNLQFSEEDSQRFAQVVDAIEDNSQIISAGYEIGETQIRRQLNRDGKILNVVFILSTGKMLARFNEHYESPDNQKVFSAEELNEFLERCRDLLQALDYEMEEG